MLRIQGWLGRVPLAYRMARAAYRAVDDWISRLQQPAQRRREIAEWRRSGSPVPPPETFKHATVRAYGRAFRLTTLVETGTYLGDMVEAQRGSFREVWSIELSPTLHREAKERFASASNVFLLEGDSGELISTVLARLDRPGLFWLDGHWSEGNTARGTLDTPVWRELEAILDSPHDHVILVDDARWFGSGDYPTLEAVRELVGKRRPGWSWAVSDDIIRITPSKSGGARSSPRRV